MIKNLYKFYWDCGRSGDVEGLFFATQESVDFAIGKDIYFGEILGKHSEIYGILEEEDLTKIELTEDISKTLIEALDENVSGYNPLEYIRCDCPVCGEFVCVDEFSIEDLKCLECVEKEETIK